VIFVTVGSMLPFDRLIQAMDEWAARHPREEVFAQIGEGQYTPRHMPFARMLSPADFNSHMATCELPVAHAGTGSMIAAAELSKPIVLLARLAHLREHTTDHQVHTAQWLAERPGVFVAPSEKALGEMIEHARALVHRGAALSATASPIFIEKIRTALVS